MNGISLETEKRVRKAMEENDMNDLRDFFGKNPGMLKEEAPSGTWLYIAVDLGKKDIVQFLLSQGVDINDGGAGKYTPLNEAVFMERIDIAKMLLEHGAHMDTNDISKNPLITAINTKNPEIVSMILEQDIDITVRYQLSYGEVDALKYAQCWSTPEIVSLIAHRYTELGIPVPEPEEKQKDRKQSRKKMDKRVLKEKLDFAVRQMVREVKNKLEQKGDKLYAMCFRMHCEDEDAEWRYLCEVITQTVRGYEKSMREYKESLKKSGGEYDTAYLPAFKYLPEEYQYTETGQDGFRKVQEYLRDCCLDLDECERIEDADEEERMYQEIQKQNEEIEEILADVVAKLRKEKFLSFYVFPYIGEEDHPADLIPLAKKMNKGLDLAEYIAFMERENG